MKFPVEMCECGLDLTTATPTRVRLGAGPNGEPVGGCPNCWRNYFMLAEEPEPEPEAPAPEAPTEEPKPEPSAEEAPAEEETPAEEPGPEVEPGEEEKGGA